MSEINVNTIDKATGSTLTVGASGTTVNIAGTAGTGFPAGTTINNNADNKVITGSGTAGTLNGETNFIYNGTIVGAGAAGASADLGVGIHIKSADSGGGVASVDADELVIEGSANSGISILSGGSDTGRFVFSAPSADNIGQLQYNHADDSMRFVTNAVERMRILYTGNVGIGETAPLGKLHVKTADSGASVNSSADEIVIEGNGDSGMTILSGNGGNGNVNFGDDGSNLAGRIQYQHNSNYMMFATNAAEAMRIASNGNLLLNTTDNDAILSVRTSDNSIVCNLNATSGSYDGNLINVTGSGSTSTNSTFNLYRGTNGNNTGQFFVRDSGNVQNTNNSYGAISDERVKQNITDANSQWDDIKAIKVRNFKLKSDLTKTHLGVVAQELETANMNGLVEEAKPEKTDVAYHSDFGTLEDGTADNGAEEIKDEDGNITGYEDVFTQGQKIKSVKYSVLYMKSIKCLQEAMEKIETLEAKVTALENA